MSFFPIPFFLFCSKSSRKLSMDNGASAQVISIGPARKGADIHDDRKSHKSKQVNMQEQVLT